jgi:hypothetical protein
MIQIGHWHGKHKVGMVFDMLFITHLIMLAGHKLKETGNMAG